MLAIVTIPARAIAAHAERWPGSVARQRGGMGFGIGDGGDDVMPAKIERADLAALIRGDALSDDRLGKGAFDRRLRGNGLLPLTERWASALRPDSLFKTQRQRLVRFSLRADSHTFQSSPSRKRLPPQAALRTRICRGLSPWETRALRLCRKSNEWRSLPGLCQLLRPLPRLFRRDLSRSDIAREFRQIARSDQMQLRPDFASH